ncbi:cation transporting P-type ATPase [Salinisphaera sp. PC39]|uniref:YHS domain-containing protein n=1 Tax=Salinisphaera sp. PC39 TaxID=1304156 RepID=UPI0033419601
MNEQSDHEHRDPVCGMFVDPTSVRSLAHAGETYYFCSERCRDKFADEPNRYLQPQPPEAQTAPAGTHYICPMCEGVETAGHLPLLWGQGTGPSTMQRIAMPNLLVLPAIYCLVSRWIERQKPGDNHG